MQRHKGRGMSFPHISRFITQIQMHWLIGRHYHMAGEIEMENGYLFIIKSFRRKCQKAHAIQQGFYKCFTKRTRGNNLCLNQEKTDQLNTKTYTNTYWATGPALGHMIQVNPLFCSSFAYSIHFKMRHRHECYKNNIQSDRKTQYDLTPDYNPDAAMITDFMSIKILHWFVQN